MSNRKHIINPGYNEFDRLEYLKEVITTGKDAESLMKFADRLLEDVKVETLEKLANNNANHEQVIMFYRVACKFVAMIKGIAKEAQRKEETYNALLKQM